MLHVRGGQASEQRRRRASHVAEVLQKLSVKRFSATSCNSGGQADGAVDAVRQGYGRVIIAQWVAGGAEPAADCFGRLFLLGGSAYRPAIGPGGAGPDMGSSSRAGWEESGRSHPARTALNRSQPS